MIRKAILVLSGTVCISGIAFGGTFGDSRWAEQYSGYRSPHFARQQERIETMRFDNNRRYVEQTFGNGSMGRVYQRQFDGMRQGFSDEARQQRGLAQWERGFEERSQRLQQRQGDGAMLRFQQQEARRAEQYYRQQTPAAMRSLQGGNGISAR